MPKVATLINIELQEGVTVIDRTMTATVSRSAANCSRYISLGTANGIREGKPLRDTNRYGRCDSAAGSVSVQPYRHVQFRTDKTRFRLTIHQSDFDQT